MIHRPMKDVRLRESMKPEPYIKLKYNIVRDRCKADVDPQELLALEQRIAYHRMRAIEAGATGDKRYKHGKVQ